MRDIVIFSGSAHRSLARTHLRRPGRRALPGRDQAVQQRLPPGPAAGQLPPAGRLHRPAARAADAGAPHGAAAHGATPRAGASAAQITAVIPHYAYARSDKKDASRISLGGRLVADMLVAAGVDRVLTMTLHAPQVHGFFSVPVDHLTAIGVLADHFRGARPRRHRRRLPRPRQRQDGHPVRPAPRPARGRRLQAAPRRRPGRHRLDRRRRRPASGRSSSTTRSPPAARSSSCSSGWPTSAAPGADVACTHGLFAGKAVERLRDHPMVREVVTTDTVPAPAHWPDLRVRSVAQLFAEAISPDPRRRVGEQPVRRGRPDPRPAAAPPCSDRDRRLAAAAVAFVVDAASTRRRARDLARPLLPPRPSCRYTALFARPAWRQRGSPSLPAAPRARAARLVASSRPRVPAGERWPRGWSRSTVRGTGPCWRRCRSSGPARCRSCR